VARRFVVLSILLWSITSVDFSWADCPKDLAKLAPEEHLKQAPSFPSWNFKDQNLKLTPEQLFPTDFIKEIEGSVGSLEMRVTFSSSQTAVKIQGVVRGQTYFTVSFFESPEYPGQILIDQLRLENPLEFKQKEHLNLDQRAKGLPPSVFRHVQKNIFELAKAGGFSQAFTNSQQHFGAAMLYRKLVGMDPSPGASAELFSEIEKIYNFARRELPEELRPSDVTVFTSWLGTVTVKPAAYTRQRADKLEHYFKTGQLDNSIQILNDKEGKPICAIFKDNEKAEGQILFIYHHFGSPRILDWVEIAVSKRLTFAKKLN